MSKFHLYSTCQQMRMRRLFTHIVNADSQKIKSFARWESERCGEALITENEMRSGYCARCGEGTATRDDYPIGRNGFEAVTFNGYEWRAVVRTKLQRPSFNSRAAALAFSSAVFQGKRIAEEVTA